MTTDMDLLSATPAEIDAAWAPIAGEIAGHEARIAAGEKQAGQIRGRRYFDPVHHGAQLARIDEAAAAARSAIDALNGRLAPFLAEWHRRDGWTRFYLVDHGHLHTDTSWRRCSRTFTTPHYWMIELSGKTKAEVVELAGERACTVCFPTAPVAVRERPSRLSTPTEREAAAARQEREDKRIAAAKTRAAKAIVDPETGEDLVITRDGRTETIATERAAAIEVVDIMWWGTHYPDFAERNAPAVEKLLAALAAKRSTTAQDERVGAEQRLAARIKRDDAERRREEKRRQDRLATSAAR